MTVARARDMILEMLNSERRANSGSPIVPSVSWWEKQLTAALAEFEEPFADPGPVALARVEQALRLALKEVRRARTMAHVATDLRAEPLPPIEEMEALEAALSEPSTLDRIIEVLERYGFHDEEQCDTADDLVAEVEGICKTAKPGFYCTKEWSEAETQIPGDPTNVQHLHAGKPHRCCYTAGHEKDDPHYCRCGAEL